MYTFFNSKTKAIHLKENVRIFQKLKKHKYLIKYYIVQKIFCLKIHFFMFLANFLFVVSQLKIQPGSCSLKYFESSDIVVVKKKNLLNVY